ncbi:MAG: MASE1 domain-containing protein [Flavobacteriaceae bacterium]
MKQTLNKWIFILVTLVSYIMFARYFNLLIFKHTQIVAIWIPAGISLSILLLKGYKYLPLVFIGNYFVAAIITSQNGISVLNTFPEHISSSILNTLEAALGAYLIFKFSNSNLILKSIKNSVTFIFVTIFISLITALIGSFFRCYFNNDWYNYFTLFWSWWIDDILAILLITPIILSFPKKILFLHKKLKILEFTLYLFFSFMFLYLIIKMQYPIKFLLFPLLLISLFRFGKFISFTSLFLIALLVGIQNSNHPLTGVYIQNKNLLIYMLYFSVASILVLVVAALIEDQKNKEEELTKSKNQFKNTLKSINEAIIVCDSNSGKILNVNDYACTWLGYSFEEFKKMSVGDLASNKRLFTKKNALIYFKKSNKAAQNFKWQIKDNKNKTYHCNIQLNKATIFESDNIIATIRDDSEKYKLEQEIIHAYIEAQEEEKQYFGEEIHDNIIQTLAAEQIFISAIDKISDKSNNKASKYIKKLNELNSNAIDAIQKIAYGLMSKQLKEEGLILTLENLCIDMSMKDQVEFNFSHKNIREKDMSNAIKTNIFRIAQELTNDCINYSDATIANLNINKTGNNTIEFIFTDNDIGLKLESLKNIDNGRSMKNIDRRLKYLNGHLTVNPNSKTGLEIKITIPLS